jgi:uncharacterized membrane protein YhiD involved in acid resistance
MQQSIQGFPPDEIATKLLLSLGIGLLVGFEREWAHKDLGVRTFAITTSSACLPLSSRRPSSSSR